MANTNNLTTAASAVVVIVAVLLSSSLPTTTTAFSLIPNLELFPDAEVTLANDGTSPIWFMCQMTDKSDSLYQLQPNATYRFSFQHIAFPMRWCYLYISQQSHGFFWAYTLRSRCTKCFWSIKTHPSLYRMDKGRWERQKLFMPSTFHMSKFFTTSPTT